MKKKILLTFFILCFYGSARAQGVNIHDIALSNVSGFAKPVGGATITVCQSTAVGTPCNVAANVYTDATLMTQALSNTVSADGNGNYSFWINPGLYGGQYIISITGVGINGYNYNLSVACMASSTCTSYNKTYTSVSSGNNVTLLNYQGATASNTGNSADKVYYTYTLLASQIRASTGIRITAYSQHTTGSAAITYKLSFGGTLSTGISPVGAANQVNKMTYEIFFPTTSTEFIGAIVTNGNTGNGLTGVTTDTASVATSANVTVNLTFNVANTDAITPKGFFVEQIQ